MKSLQSADLVTKRWSQNERAYIKSTKKSQTLWLFKIHLGIFYFNAAACAYTVSYTHLLDILPQCRYNEVRPVAAVFWLHFQAAQLIKGGSLNRDIFIADPLCVIVMNNYVFAVRCSVDIGLYTVVASVACCNKGAVCIFKLNSAEPSVGDYLCV